ncbi:alcohol oxidase [Daedaleopsis nitida]|nr:alcohol oxidase [Daedaleopsis nitida]
MHAVRDLLPEDVGTPVVAGGPVLMHPDISTYDYIIVGGGTSGCVLASRLSEDNDVSVLLIEQGPIADTWMSRVPLLSSNIYDKDSLAVRWWSLPLREANNRFVEIMRGEALGGTTRINGMLYTRGYPGDYNRWRDLGNPGWGYEDLEQYFVKSESTRDHPASSYRAKHGPWFNQQCATPSDELSSHISRAIARIGIERVADLNAPNIPAACTAALDVVIDEKSQRCSTDRAFLPREVTLERQARLKICPNAIVSRVLLAETGGELRANGIYFEATDKRRAKDTYFATARREVILCAGALGSPQVLMLSGLGPKEHLQEKHIPVLRDMPAVGSYLQDHVGVPVDFEVPLSDSLHELQVRPFKAVVEFLKYLLTGSGRLSRPLQSWSTFIPTHLLDDDCVLSNQESSTLDTSLPDNRPDIELMHLPNNCTDTEDNPVKGIYTFLLTLVRPISQGTVRLATMNPRARPDVDLGFLTNPEDYVPLRKGVRLIRRIGESVREQGYIFQENRTPQGDRDEDIDRFIRAHIRTCFHFTSTCRMGIAVDGERPSVVDAELKVHGVRGLRVCDTSVFPEIIASHTMAPAVVVAEKCAALMKSAL